MRKKAMKLISVMLAIFMAFAAVPLSGDRPADIQGVCGRGDGDRNIRQARH